jgi:two-component system, chemotaxis family, chemotaxis protein CheY
MNIPYAADTPAVLVVDDVATARIIVSSMLEDMGFTRILEARDGEEALALLGRSEVALVISDYNMSPASGLDLLKGLRERGKLDATPFIMVSAVDDESVVEAATALGASGYLTKPLRFDRLRSGVMEALRPKMA